MKAFQFRPCKSRAKFKHNQIRRDIEVVITGLTRNIVGSVTHYSLKLRCLSAFTPCATALSEICISQFSRNLVSRRKPIQFYMETYRSGHNGADSKSVCEQSHVSSNLTVSAKDNRNLRIAVVFFCKVLFIGQKVCYN